MTVTSASQAPAGSAGRTQAAGTQWWPSWGGRGGSPEHRARWGAAATGATRPGRPHRPLASRAPRFRVSPPPPAVPSSKLPASSVKDLGRAAGHCLGLSRSPVRVSGPLERPPVSDPRVDPAAAAAGGDPRPPLRLHPYLGCGRAAGGLREGRAPAPLLLGTQVQERQARWEGARVGEQGTCERAGERKERHAWENRAFPDAPCALFNSKYMLLVSAGFQQSDGRIHAGA